MNEKIGKMLHHYIKSNMISVEEREAKWGRDAAAAHLQLQDAGLQN
jgi:hypothetical protein